MRQARSWATLFSGEFISRSRILIIGSGSTTAVQAK